MERMILVAEDSLTQAGHLRLLLEGEGYRVDVVRNGREGLEGVQIAPPDLIVSDVVMPQIGGYAFCRAIKSQERTRRIPVVLLTERNTPADVITGLQHGADNFITKPFEDDYLLDRVRRIFENLELRRQGRLDVEITLSAGGRQIVINADKQQIVELLFATLEDLVRMNDRFVETQRIVEEYAKSLEAKVQERTQQLLQTEKLATLGELIAGIAHELNNPLSAMVGHAQLLRASQQDPAVAARAERIVEAARRATWIVRNFLTFARKHRPQKAAVSVNEVVAKTLDLLRYQLRVANVEVQTDLDPSLPAIEADPYQLQQVVLNLLNNARQAMAAAHGQGALRIGSALTPDRRSVRVTVADDGPGILPEHLSQRPGPSWPRLAVSRSTSPSSCPSSWTRWRRPPHGREFLPTRG